jgi:hypothetical protein
MRCGHKSLPVGMGKMHAQIHQRNVYKKTCIGTCPIQLLPDEDLASYPWNTFFIANNHADTTS